MPVNSVYKVLLIKQRWLAWFKIFPNIKFLINIDWNMESGTTENTSEVSQEQITMHLSLSI